MRIIFVFIMLQSAMSFSQIGIGLNKPEAMLDVNGNVIVRDLKNAVNTDVGYYQLMADSRGELFKLGSEPSNYSAYLGYDPMASSHTYELLTVLEDGYITTITGISIGACYGVPVQFTLTYKGHDLLKAEIFRYKIGTSVTEGTVVIYAENEADLYAKPLEQMASTICSGLFGHTLTATTTGNVKQLQVAFSDKSPYYKDAGIFSISNVVKTKYIIE